MSGGSYDYLCHATDVAELLNAKMGALQGMAERLASMGHAQDAAQETLGLLLDLRAIEVRSQVIIARLSPVWKAVEWVDSCDWGPDSITAALRRYRGQPEHTP